MKKNIFLLFFILILLAEPMSADMGNSSSYSLGNVGENIVGGEGESTTYTMEFESPYGQNTQTGGSSESYYFGQYTGDIEVEEEDPTPPYSGSSGGGGNTAEPTEIDFNVSPDNLKYFIKVGQEKSKDITIQNKGEEDITISIIESSGFIGVESKTVKLNAGQSKKLSILVSAMNQNAGIYSSKILLKSGGVEEEVTLLIEIEEKQSEIDVLVDVIEEDKILTNKKNISSELVLYDLEGKENLNVTLDYYIQDIDGNVLIHESEKMNVNSGTSFVKSLNFENELQEGDYIFSVKASSGEKTVFSGSLFKVTSEEEKEQLIKINEKDYGLVIRIGLFVFLLLIIILLYESERINLLMWLCEFNVKHKDFYHAKINYNKLVKIFNRHVFDKGKRERISKEIKKIHKFIVEEEKEHNS